VNSRQLRTDEAFAWQLAACGLQPGADERERLWQEFLAGYELGRSQGLQGSGHWQPGARAFHEGRATAVSEAAAAELPKHLGHPDDQAEAWLSEQYEDPGPEGCSYDREDIQGAYRAGVAEARRQLGPAWAALAARRDKLEADGG